MIMWNGGARFWVIVLPILALGCAARSRTAGPGAESARADELKANDALIAQARLLGPYTQRALLDDVAELWDRCPEQRGELLEAVVRAGPQRVPCLRIILRGLTDPDAPVAWRARAVARESQIRGSEIVLAALTPGTVEGAAALVWEGPRRLRREVITESIYLVARGEEGPQRLLQAIKADGLPAVRLARAISELPEADCRHLSAIFDPVDQWEAAEMISLCEADQKISLLLAQVILTGKLNAKLHSAEARADLVRHVPVRDERFVEFFEWAMRWPEEQIRLAAVTRVGSAAAELIDPRLRRAAEPLMRDGSGQIRVAARRIVVDEKARMEADVAEILQNLRSADPAQRMVAARRLESLGCEPAEVSRALIRATDRGDFAVREGLVRAIEEANRTRRATLEVLKELAAQEEEITIKAYAVAALREVEASR